MKRKTKIIIVGILLTAILLVGAVGAKLALDKVNTIFGKLEAMESDLGSRIDLAASMAYTASEKTEDLRYTLAKSQKAYDFDYSWLETVPPLVAHAFGGIDGNSYTNAKEAFLYNYEQGYRIFEVDFEVTDENTLVLSHDADSWRSQTGLDESVEMTYETFMSTPIMGSYTPMDYKALIDLMIEYPDIYIVTDSKYLDRATVFMEFSQLVRYAENTDPSVLDRIVPQIYHEYMLEWVMDVHPFKSIIYTLYASARTPEQVYDFCESTGVKMVTCRDELSQDTIDSWTELGISISVHTINDLSRANELMDQGVDLLYTDFLQPKDFI